MSLTVWALVACAVLVGGAAVAIQQVPDWARKIMLGRFDFHFPSVMKAGHKAPTDGREMRLLEHVLEKVPGGDAEGVLAAIDAYAWNKSSPFFMLVGDRKGAILQQAIANCTPTPRVAMELGTYVGYGATRISTQLRRMPGGEASRLLTIEYEERNVEVARSLLRHAGLEGSVEVLHGTLSANLEAVHARLQQLGAPGLDLVFIDHDKDVYLSDLQLLLEHKLLSPGATVVADNLMIPGAPDYWAWLREGQPGHELFETEFHRTSLEYTEGVEDVVSVSKLRGTGAGVGAAAASGDSAPSEPLGAAAA